MLISFGIFTITFQPLYSWEIPEVNSNVTRYYKVTGWWLIEMDLDPLILINKIPEENKEHSGWMW